MKIYCEIPLSVIITHYVPATRGRLYGPPEDCYPAEPAEIEFTLLTPGGVTLGKPDFPDSWDSIEEEIIEAYENALQDAADEARIDAYIDYMESY